MSSYLVTGGAGFIGSHLVDYLISLGHEVTVFDSLFSGKKANINKAAQFIHASITDKKDLNLALDNIDLCYHLAAIPSVQHSISHWSECHEINVGGSVNVFEAAAARNIPVIYASSAAIYGNTKQIPITEDASISPESPYGFDKYATEVQAKLFGNLKGLKTVGLRFFNVYGARQSPDSLYSGVIPVFIKKLLEGQKIQIFGDGNQSRDFVYVEDVVQALVKAADSKVLNCNTVFNVCSDQAISINFLAEILGKLLNQEVKIEYLPVRSEEVYKSLGNSQKLRELTGYQASITIEDGLRKLIDSMI